MESKTYSRKNFHSHTFCVWNEVGLSEIKDYKINYKSLSGSSYIFAEEGVYRISNHWGRVADCYWRLLSSNNYKNQNQTVGYARWADFYSNDPFSKIFYIMVDFQNKHVNFYHKDYKFQDRGEAVLKNAGDTAKTIKIIKSIFTDTSWAKYLDYDDYNRLQQEVVRKLLITNHSFIEIKKDFMG